MGNCGLFYYDLLNDSLFLLNINRSSLTVAFVHKLNKAQSALNLIALCDVSQIYLSALSITVVCFGFIA